MPQQEKQLLAENPAPSETLPSVVSDAHGREVARRIATPFGEAWVAKNRLAAAAAELVGPKKKTALPVYFLDGDEAVFVASLPDAARRNYHEFKRVFDSPAEANTPEQVPVPGPLPEAAIAVNAKGR